MKTNIKKILCFILILLFCTNSVFATVIYSPSANNDTIYSPLTPQVNVSSPMIGTSTNRITNTQAEAISQIVVDGSGNVAMPVAEPTAITYSNGQDISQSLGPGATSYINPTNVQVFNSGNAFPTNSLNSTNNVNVIQTYKANELNSATLTVKSINGTVPECGAPAYILINATTRHIYASKDMDKHFEPAGLANLMTAYLASLSFSLDYNLPVTNTAVKGVDKDAAIAALNNGDTITVRDAITSMFVKGCVDSANVIAENVSGTIPDFVKLMNSTAKSLGLENTYFENPSGITCEAQQSSAKDMAIIMGKVCENEDLVKLLGITQYTLPKAKARDTLTLFTKNTQMIKTSSVYNKDVVCSRLGYNSKAKYCIASMMNYNGNTVIAVALKANGSQFNDTKKLLDFGKIACEQDQ